MLKPDFSVRDWIRQQPAAFGRLCVETDKTYLGEEGLGPAAFGRLCVETVRCSMQSLILSQPPSGGCVLKLAHLLGAGVVRQPAAFGRLCVETHGLYLIR